MPGLLQFLHVLPLQFSTLAQVFSEWVEHRVPEEERGLLGYDRNGEAFRNGSYNFTADGVLRSLLSSPSG